MRRLVLRYLHPTVVCRIAKNKSCLLLLVLVVVLAGATSTLYFTNDTQQPAVLQQQQQQQQHLQQQLQEQQQQHHEQQMSQLDNVLASDKLSSSIEHVPATPSNEILTQDLLGKNHLPLGLKKPKPCYDVHIFYYPWYGNPQFDKRYLHWNHKYIPHWSPDIAKMYPNGAHKPPDDVAANFFPALGAYSSQSEEVIRAHMQQLSFAGVGVVVVSYYPPGMGDDNGDDWQSIFPKLLKVAHVYKIKITFHIEPYRERSEVTVKNDIEHIIDTYSKHPAFYKLMYKDKLLPLLYIYDSYHTKPQAWAGILKPGGFDSIRGTEYDCFVIGLVVEQKHQQDMVDAGFDGFYTYFASVGFTYGSSRENWNILADFAERNDLLYIPSVGPGYIDTRVRPWNSGNTRKRARGQYYRESWREALKVKPNLISITSFNEWHEGTQIEKAVPKTTGNFKYLDYSPKGPDYYLLLTKQFVTSFVKQKKTGAPVV